MTYKGFRNLVAHLWRLLTSRAALGAYCFVLGAAVTAVIWRAVDLSFGAVLDQKQYEITTEICSPLRRAELTLENKRTGKKFYVGSIKMLNRLAILVRNTGTLHLSNSEITIGFAGIQGDPEVLFVHVYSSSLSSARDSDVRRDGPVFNVDKSLLNPNEFVLFDVAVDRPVAVYVEARQPGITYAELRDPGCTDFEGGEVPMVSKVFSYVSDKCQHDTDGTKCELTAFTFPFDVPGDFAPGDVIIEHWDVVTD